MGIRVHFVNGRYDRAEEIPDLPTSSSPYCPECGELGCETVHNPGAVAALAAWIAAGPPAGAGPVAGSAPVKAVA